LNECPLIRDVVRAELNQLAGISHFKFLRTALQTRFPDFKI
jgi:hypothetical protein